jgi:hypothetical protein
MNAVQRIPILAGIPGRVQTVFNLAFRRDIYEHAFDSLPRIGGPALVVGSAPGSFKPAGVGPGWFVLSINGSQSVTEEFGFPVPDITVLRRQIAEQGFHQDMVSKVLTGQRTRHLVLQSPSEQDVLDWMPTINYTADKVTVIGPGIKTTLIADVTGLLFPRVGRSWTMSNGLFATLLALKLGATRVVMSGFSFTEQGWKQGNPGLGSRDHIKADRLLCATFRSHGLPVFANEPAFAEESGLPLWQGRAD